MRTVGAGAEKPGNGAAGAGLKKELEELMAENRRLRMENEELGARVKAAKGKG